MSIGQTQIDEWTPLHAASYNNHAGVVKLVLAHPVIDINVKNSGGDTPLLISCQKGQVSVVQLLLKDPRVDVTLDDPKGRTPLWCAACFGRHEVVEWLIASGRDLGDFKNKKGKYWAHDDHTALDIAREKGETGVVSLLERFMTTPTQTRHELRVKLGVLDELAVEVFALIVFLCDDLLHLKPARDTATPSSVKFFTVVSKLPMILCHRAVDSMKQNILHKDSEAAFKSLARTLLRPS